MGFNNQYYIQDPTLAMFLETTTSLLVQRLGVILVSLIFMITSLGPICVLIKLLVIIFIMIIDCHFKIVIFFVKQKL